MATVQVTHTIDGLIRDLRLIPRTMRVRGKAVVARNVDLGTMLTKRAARAAAGPHGVNYHKRISGEMTGPLEGEFGPSAVLGTRYTGVSGSAGAMRDLEKAADKVGPRFAAEVGRMADDLFWPGG